MTTEPTSAFVWIWLPDDAEPVVCGRLEYDGDSASFAYVRSYLDRSDAVPIYEPELPLRRGRQHAATGQGLPLCIADAMPDAWGRRLVNHRLGSSTAEFGELTYLLESGSDRFGALDAQAGAERYEQRGDERPTLDVLATAAERIEAGEPLGADLEAALLRGTSIGGARPKALIDDGERRLIAKFSSTGDPYPVVQGEFVAMELARRVGLDVAEVQLTRAAGRYALLVERFDRAADRRRRAVSALTILGLDAFPGGRYATYVGLADEIRAQFVRPDASLRELFARISFNILCGNTDDHARNHAALIEPAGLVLSPAYDLCPQGRVGETASQAMALTRDGGRDARLSLLVDAAAEYHLDRVEAQAIVDRQATAIRGEWNEVCDLAELTESQRDAFLGRQFLNPHAFT
ncbi:MAG: type II toxin-antitoxin system HipA family toxin [Acidimicrobiales bacterium]|nr:type II toxin-antitoxin system HipA family toxin [Acidimicrobiales bacterium]